MMHRPRLAMLLASFGIAAICGCGGGRNADLARQAEDRGDPQVAYDYYCRAAQEHRNSLTVTDGLERTRPAAAAYWERQALSAADDGRYDTAWQCWMKTIEIQPDHATAAQMIRQLETEHSMQVAAARENWVRRGSAALPSARLEPRGTTAVASGDGRDTDTALAARQPAARPRAERAPRTVDRKPRGDTLASGSTSNDARSDQRQSGEVDDADESDETRATGRSSRPGGSASRSGDQLFAEIRTYSMDDPRFPRTGDGIDGITIKLKDTDEDDGVIDVDLDLFNGGVRIRKVRELRVGRSLTFRGASGQTFRLTIISAHHRTHTVRIGFKPA